MLTYQLLEKDNIVILEPKGPLSEGDFGALTEDVDRHLAKADRLEGVLVHAKEFPGWKSLGGMLSHLRFVRDHHRKIRRVALASDSALAEIAPKLVEHFVSAEVKRFAYDEREAALQWLRGDG